MPKLDVPQEQPVPGPDVPGLGYEHRLLEGSAEAAARIGQDLQQHAVRMNNIGAQGLQDYANDTDKLGREIIATGSKYMDEASTAGQDSALNKAYSAASIEYAKAVQNRTQHAYDQHGNPTYSTLPDDINSVGNDIMNRYSQNLPSDVQDKFQQAFTHLITNHTISSMSIARRQQLDDSKASLGQVLNTDVQNGLTDADHNLPFHYAHGLQAINSAVQNGTLSMQDAVEQRDMLRRSLFVGRLQARNEFDPGGVRDDLLHKSNEELNITQQEREQLGHLNQRALDDQQRRWLRIQADQQKALKADQNKNAGDMEIDMQKGKVGEADIMKAYQDGKIGYDHYKNLTLKYLNDTGETLKNSLAHRSIATAIQSGDSLSKFSDEQISKSYLSDIQMQSSPDHPISMQNKAVTAANYRAPISAFSRDLSITARSGSPQDIAEAAKAYAYIQNKQPIVVSKMDKQDKMFYSMVNEQLQYTNQNPDQIIQHAKDVVYDKDPDRVKVNTALYNKEDAFKAENIEETIRSSLAGHFSGNVSLTPEVMGHLIRLTKDAYLITGDKDAALKYMDDETQGIIGTSELNTTPADYYALRDTKRIMFAPPEKVYSQYTPQELRADLEKQVQPILPEGVKAEDVLIGSDQLTTRNLGGIGSSGKAETSYNMYYIKDGHEVPLLDKTTGQPLRWIPNTHEIDQDRLNASIAKQTSDLQKRQALEDSQMFNPRFTDRNKLYPNGYPSVNASPDAHASSVQNVMDAIAHVETGNEQSPYSAVGPSIHNGTDQALGKYQIMQSNLAEWSKEALGRVVSKEEFLNNPRIQDQIAANKIGEYMNQYHNVQDVISMWHSGRPLSEAVAANAHDVNMTTAHYVQLAMNKMRGDSQDGSKDPAFFVTTAANKASQEEMTSNMSDYMSLSPKIGKYLASNTSENENISYEYGSKNLSGGTIDCSGWVANNTLNAMRRINTEEGQVYNLNKMSDLLNQGAAWQITSIGKQVGYIPTQDIMQGNVQPGTLIGIHYADTSARANSRPLGIAHIVQVVQQNGELYVSQATDGLKHATKTGVSLTPYSQFIQSFGDGDKLYAVNPFMLMNSTHNKVYDQGTGNNMHLSLNSEPGSYTVERDKDDGKHYVNNPSGIRYPVGYDSYNDAAQAASVKNRLLG